MNWETRRLGSGGVEQGFVEHDVATAVPLKAPWRKLAACRGADPELWFPHPGQDGRPAIAVCAGCCVRLECLADAIDANEKLGIWGGLPEARRTIIRRRQRRGAA